jgi:hypothetical protein
VTNKSVVQVIKVKLARSSVVSNSNNFPSVGISVDGVIHLLATAMLLVAIPPVNITVEASVLPRLHLRVATQPITIPTATAVTPLMTI